jgi:hypothetical protein
VVIWQTVKAAKVVLVGRVARAGVRRVVRVDQEVGRAALVAGKVGRVAASGGDREARAEVKAVKGEVKAGKGEVKEGSVVGAGAGAAARIAK